jgi:hydrophobe/amphiphile efflux-3 (HAE3) family protein
VPTSIFERVARAAVRRAGLVVAVCALLAAGGGLLALTLRPSAGTETLVDRDAETFQATERYHERFGEDAVLVLVRGDLARIVLTSNLGRLLGLEGCISGNVPREVSNVPGGREGPCARLARERPAQVVYGPGTFVNEAVRQIQTQFSAQQRAEARRERRAANAARRLAAAQGRSKADQERLARQARELVRAEFLRDTLRLALNYGIRSMPALNDPGFVSQLVFDSRRRKTGRCAADQATYVPKARFAYLFPSECSALIQVRLRPDLDEAQRERAISLIREATQMRDDSPRKRDFRLEGASYTVSGAPVVVSALTDRLSRSIAILLVAALAVMALTLLLVFRSPPRRAARLLPLAVALGSCGLLFGAMAAVGASLTMASIAVLPVLVGLAVDYAIQFHARFDEAMRDDGLSPRDAAPVAARMSGPTIATACLATGAGFLVLVLSPVPMVRGFGALLVAGIAIAFALALTGGFAALALAGGGPRRATPAPLRGAGDALAAAGRGARDILAGLGGAWLWHHARSGTATGARRAMHEATTRPARVLAIALGLAVVGFGLDTQTRVVSDVQKLVPQDLQALRDLDEVQKRTGVSGQIDVTVEADDLTDPRVISWMTRYQQRLLKRFGYTAERGCGRAELCPALSLPDLFRTQGAARDRGQVRALLDAVPPYFSQAVITPDRRLATMAFGIRLMALDRQQEVIDQMRRSLDPPPGVRAELVGLPVLAAEANQRVSSDWRRLMTVLAGLLAVSLALLLVYRRAERALVPLVPIAMAGGWSALVLFAIRVPLNPLSVTLGALVIAIATEFSVLLSERYRQERRRGLEPTEALSRTYASTGAAVAASGTTAIAGFAVLVLSDVRMLREFGVVAVVDLAVSLLGVLVVLPAVLLMAESGELRELPGRAARAVRARLRVPRRRARAART